MGINEIIAQGVGTKPSWNYMESRGRALNQLSAEQGIRKNELLLSEHPEEQAWKRENREMEREKWGMEKEEFAEKKSERAYKKAKRSGDDLAAAMSSLDNLIQIATPENWDDVVSTVAPKGIVPDVIPRLKDIELKAIRDGVTNTGDFRDYFGKFVNGQVRSWKSKIAEMNARSAGQKVVGKSLVGPTGNEIYREPEREKQFEPKMFMRGNKPTWVTPGQGIPEGAMPWQKETKESQPEIIKLLEAYNSSDDESTKKFLMGRMNKLTETSGLSLRMNKDGDVELVQGPGVKGGVSGFGKATQTEIEKKLFTVTEGLSRLSGIEKSFLPEYQEMGTRWDMLSYQYKEKAGFKLAEKDRAKLADYSKFKRRAFEHLNKYLNEISGAAVTEQEANRLKKSLPDPGEGVIDGDSPTVFESKMKDAIQSSKYAIARYNYAAKNGMNWKSISLENMPDMINERATQIEAQIKKPGMDSAALRAEVKRRLQEEFGIMGK